MKINLILWIAAIGITACAPVQGPASGTATLPPDTAVTSPPSNGTPQEPVASPFAPQPGDDTLTRGPVFIQEMDLLIRESFPPQIALVLMGELPTPCHQLRVQVDKPDAENRVSVDVYSVVDPDLVCIQVLEPFEETINLGTYPTGHYTVWINEELAGEFDS